ncbi:KipI family sensor histidine kinase inhibitor [Pararhizobium capsulatum DSM 1112]|uniref:KipI family sensor histidine kinase inhibitor n=2 Tax=Pararhizobium capsulatum TaxID=34014 RepID=A0ABU0BXI4_9HYPH|nr:KipI family sensor histidine kinase inhibitor [Pararhizobium capsulatum DSM 1112]
MAELVDLETTLTLLDRLLANPPEGVIEMIPAARTVMIRFDPLTTDRARLGAFIRGLDLTERSARRGDLFEIPVTYDGEDLGDVADILGWSVEEVVRRHTAATYTVAFTGFAPGFAYMTSDDPAFDVPRRKSPRVRIPAGAVALGGKFGGIYPSDSPGGWQLLGRTPLAMWDTSRARAALLAPGDRVRFRDMAKGVVVSGSLLSLPPLASPPLSEKFSDVPVGEIGTPHYPPLSAELTEGGNAASSGRIRPSVTLPSSGKFFLQQNALHVIRADRPALYQDFGRAGRADQGVGQSGALDRAAMQEVNLALGNPRDDAVIEVTFGGFAVRADGPVTSAVFGAPSPLVIRTADGRDINAPFAKAFALDAGDTLTLGIPSEGMRSYLALRGGFAVKPVLGSASTDTLSKVGPAPIVAGDVLVPANGRTIAVDPARPLPPRLPRTGETVTLDVILGPRTDWFTANGVETLLTQEWSVTPESSRVGMRLSASSPIERRDQAELPSEATAIGAIQVPHTGQPVLFLADHPLTGGYPVIGSVARHHLDLAGQIPIGARIRFNPISGFDPEDAETVSHES